MTFIGELHYIKCITHTSVHTQTHGGNKGGKQEGGNERAEIRPVCVRARGFTVYNTHANMVKPETGGSAF